MLLLWKYKTVLALSLLIAIITTLYSYNKHLELKITDLIIDNKQSEQNRLAYIDSVNRLPDSIQIYKVFVRELENNLKDTNNKNKRTLTLLHNKIIILEDTIRFLRAKIEDFESGNEGTDSAFVKFKMFRENELVQVYGDAVVFTIKKTGDYQLSIVNKEKTLHNYLDFDFNDSLITSFTSINDGQKIKSFTTVSPALQSMLIRNVDNISNYKRKWFYGAEIGVITNDFNDYQIIPELFLEYNILDNFKIRSKAGYNQNGFIGVGFRIDL
jgi:hypothetical protein